MTVTIMQSLLTLTFSFVLLSAYLEWVAPPAQQQATPTRLSQIVRTQTDPVIDLETPANHESYTQTIHKPRPIIRKALRVLNLSLPINTLADAGALHMPAQLVLESSEQNPATKIRYNAELVYDLDKGEDITGGKVNIEIPFG